MARCPSPALTPSSALPGEREGEERARPVKPGQRRGISYSSHTTFPSPGFATTAAAQHHGVSALSCPALPGLSPGTGDELWSVAGLPQPELPAQPGCQQAWAALTTSPIASVPAMPERVRCMTGTRRARPQCLCPWPRGKSFLAPAPIRHFPLGLICLLVFKAKTGLRQRAVLGPVLTSMHQEQIQLTCFRSLNGAFHTRYRPSPALPCCKHNCRGTSSFPAGGRGVR